MKSLKFKILALAAIATTCALPASAAVSDTVGYNTITCLANSDTIVGVPLRQAGSVKGSLNGAITDNGNDTATLILSASPSDTDIAFSHYLQFTSGTKNGQYFTIGANNGTSVTIDLNGGNLTGVVSTGESADTFIIAKYWTLNDLFPPAEATTAWDGEGVPNGHAIVASTGTLGFQQKTLVLFPNMDGNGINRAPNQIFLIVGSSWATLTGPSNAGSLQLMPDAQLIIRHPDSVQATSYTVVGEVIQDHVSIPITTSSTGKQDTRLGLPRPVDVKLSDLNLVESGAFAASAGTLGFQRQDELFIYNNASVGKNKAPSFTYYYDSSSSHWRDASNAIADDAVIPAGAGILVRKASGDGNAVWWDNPASY